MAGCATGAGAACSTGGVRVVQAESASTDKAATLASNRRSRSDAPMEGLLKALVEPARTAAPGLTNDPVLPPGPFDFVSNYPLWCQQIWPLRPGFGGLRAGTVSRAVAAGGRGPRRLATRPRRFARVLERRRFVDAQRPHLLGVLEKITVGAQAHGMDAGNGADVVHLVGIAGDADGAHHLARLVADELAAAFEEQRIIGKIFDRLHEQRLLVR